MSSPSSKRQRTSAPIYELLYYPGIPGRGEFIRLVFEATGTEYTDVANDHPPSDSGPNGYGVLQKALSPDITRDEFGNPPVFAPPMLRIVGAAKDGKPLLIHQTPNILQYLGEKLGVGGSDEAERLWINQLALTALDLNNECHDTHHPVAVMEYYEDQKDEALKKATDFRKSRIPKFFSYFERTLRGNQEGGGEYLISNKLSYADTTLWQVIDGLKFAFPKEMEARKADYPLLFGTFYGAMKERTGIKSYLESDRRLKYSNGVFRHYPELDRQ
ncbi:hypothetical protein LTR66_007708 [Elasticomyces elasticus]|nr:hypothetical protein LTR66_007708 [Elasticomyces elasticus]